jgi:exonuclease SbcC
MRLHRVRLQNFRQHADTAVEFGPGLTGIIGPNGAGKTTLLEAVVWALYGQKAARDRKETIRWRRARPRAEVRVELEFALGAHEFRVVRTLSHAELYLDGGARPVAQTLAAVGERIEKLLGMRYEEFHNTYFTGQRDLAVMRDVGPTDRRRFLNRLLDYERLELAQRRVREDRRALHRDIETLRLDHADPAALAAERDTRAADDAAAAGRLEAAEAALEEVRAASDQHLPVFAGLKEFRARHQELSAAQREVTGGMKAAVELIGVLSERHASAAAAAVTLERLRPEVEAWEMERAALAELDALAADAEVLARLETTLEELDRHSADLARRVAAAREAAAAALAAAERLEQSRSEREEVEKAWEERKDAWEREKVDATVERRKLLDHYNELRDQRERIVDSGSAGTCPTCGRPLGSEYHVVLDLLDTQLEGVTQNGQYYRSKLETLKAVPIELLELDRRRHLLSQSIETLAQDLAIAKRAADDALALEKETLELAARRSALEEEAARRRTGYDRARHEAARARVAALEAAVREAQLVTAAATEAPRLAAELEVAERRRAELVDRFAALQRDLDSLSFSEDRYLSAEVEMKRLEAAWRDADRAAVQARADRRLAAERLADAEQRERDAAARAARLSELRGSVRLHDALDAAFGDLSAELNAEIGPEMGRIASGFIASLTDGQFDEIELDESFDATVLSDGEPQPVLSGGEQDLRDLALRLAVSQMIAERSGQPFTLLVLDEVFGALDDLYRQNVVNLLRGLEARFPQVILITHVEPVRETLDRVLRVRFDAGSGTSLVTEEKGGGLYPGGADAHVAA